MLYTAANDPLWVPGTSVLRNRLGITDQAALDEAELARAFCEYGDPDEVADLPKEAFARQTAHLLAEINAVHPFREGNGRTQLAFLTLLAANAGYGINNDALDPDEVLSAMIESFAGSEDRLSGLILALLID